MSASGSGSSAPPACSQCTRSGERSISKTRPSTTLPVPTATYPSRRWDDERISEIPGVDGVAVGARHAHRPRVRSVMVLPHATGLVPTMYWGQTPHMRVTGYGSAQNPGQGPLRPSRSSPPASPRCPRRPRRERRPPTTAPELLRPPSTGTPSRDPSPTPTPTPTSSAARTAGGTATPRPTRSARAATRHLIPMSKSRDLVHWQFAEDAFTTLPSWADTGRRRLDVGAGRALRRSRPVADVLRRHRDQGHAATWSNDNAIGMATAPSPLGPWKDSGGPVVGPRRGGPEQLPLDVRPRGGPGPRRHPAPLLRLVLRRDLPAAADRRTARRPRATRPASPSTTSSRAPTSPARTATGTSSAPPPTAAPARPPATASRSRGRGR